MTPALRRAAIVSGVLHAAVIAALLIGFATDDVKDAPPEEQVVEMAVLDGPAQVVMKADQPSDVPAPAVTPQAVVAPPATDPTLPLPPEPPAPAPPPPQAAPPPPIVPPSPPVPQPPPPVPPPPDQAELPQPPIPPPPPIKPPPVPPAQVAPPPTPPAAITAKVPGPPSRTNQPNPSKNVAPDSRELDATLDKLRSLQKQTKPPTRKANPLQGGAPRVGGSVNGDVTATLTGEQRGAIGDQVRECWTKDAGAKDIDKMSVALIVTVDETGIARDAAISPEDQGRVDADPFFRAFAERAVRAPLQTRCSDFSKMMPRADLGRATQLRFRFKP